MKASIDIGSAPPTENCAQVGTPDYDERARRECRALINLLRRTLGPEPIGARLCLRSNPHDFGTYLSVVCEFDEERPESVEYAYRCESQTPSEWDDEARHELENHAPARR